MNNCIVLAVTCMNCRMIDWLLCNAEAIVRLNNSDPNNSYYNLYSCCLLNCS